MMVPRRVLMKSGICTPLGSKKSSSSEEAMMQGLLKRGAMVVSSACEGEEGQRFAPNGRKAV